jgi:hypothetical protein
MQFMHAAIAATTAFLILKYAPFRRFQRILLIFGYFFIFEYALISRNYAIGILLVTIYLSMYRYRTRFLIPSALLLFLMAQTNVFATILSMAFLAAWVFEFAFSEPFRKEILLQKWSLTAACLIVLAGFLWSVLSVIPQSNGFFAGSSHFSFSQLTLRETIRTIATVWKAWFPVPILNRQFWETNIERDEPVQAVFSLLLLFPAILLWLRRPVILFLFITGLSGILAFILMFYYGYIRHHGHLYVLLIICLWLSAYYRESRFTFNSAFLAKFHRWLRLNISGIFTVLLLIQLFAGMYAYTVHLFIPFSTSRITAQYIRRNNLDRFMMAGDKDIALEPVLGYLNKEGFFFSRNAFSTYIIYDNIRRVPFPSRVLVMADSLARTQQDTILLVMNYPLENPAGLNLIKVAAFEKSIRYDEISYLYLLIPPETKQNHSARDQIIH